eukprot:3344188-Amphidinium_carterae.1
MDSERASGLDSNLELWFHSQRKITKRSEEDPHIWQARRLLTVKSKHYDEYDPLEPRNPQIFRGTHDLLHPKGDTAACSALGIAAACS